MTCGSNHVASLSSVNPNVSTKPGERLSILLLETLPVGDPERAVDHLHDVLGPDRDPRIRRLAVGVRPTAPGEPVEARLLDRSGHSS